MQTALYGSIGWKHPAGIYQVIDWANEFGWDSVDARGMTLDIPGGPRKQLTAFGYDMLGPRQIRQSCRQDLVRKSQQAEVPIVCLYVPAPVNLNGQLGIDCRNLFREFIQLAADLKIPWVRAINNSCESYTDQKFTPQVAFEQAVAGFQDVGRDAAEHNVGILLENNENTVTSCANDLLKLKAELESTCRTGIAYDATNAYFQGLNELEELATLDGAIDFLHLKNVRRHSDPKFAYLPHGDVSYEWTSLQEGDVQWRAILKKAISAGFDGVLTFEYVNPFKGMPTDYWNVLREPTVAASEEIQFINSILASHEFNQH